MLGEKSLAGRSSLFLRREIRTVLATPSLPSASHFKSYWGSDKCGAVFRLIDDLPACFCMGRYLCLEPILPVATPVAGLWRSTCKPYELKLNKICRCLKNAITLLFGLQSRVSILTANLRKSPVSKVSPPWLPPVGHHQSSCSCQHSPMHSWSVFLNTHVWFLVQEQATSLDTIYLHCQFGFELLLSSVLLLKVNVFFCFFFHFIILKTKSSCVSLLFHFVSRMSTFLSWPRRHKDSLVLTWLRSAKEWVSLSLSLPPPPPPPPLSLSLSRSLELSRALSLSLELSRALELSLSLRSHICLMTFFLFFLHSGMQVGHSRIHREGDWPRKAAIWKPWSDGTHSIGTLSQYFPCHPLLFSRLFSPARLFLPDLVFWHLGELTRASRAAWCCEIGSLTSLDACNSGASSDVREPISLHQPVGSNERGRKAFSLQLFFLQLIFLVCLPFFLSTWSKRMRKMTLCLRSAVITSKRPCASLADQSATTTFANTRCLRKPFSRAVASAAALGMDLKEKKGVTKQLYATEQ